MQALGHTVFVWPLSIHCTGGHSYPFSLIRRQPLAALQPPQEQKKHCQSALLHHLNNLLNVHDLFDSLPLACYNDYATGTGR